MLYGASPINDPDRQRRLRPVMTFEAGLIAIRDLAAGESIGYGGRFTCKRPTRVGVVAAGAAGDLQSLGAVAEAVHHVDAIGADALGDLERQRLGAHAVLVEQVDALAVGEAPLGGHVIGLIPALFQAVKLKDLVVEEQKINNPQDDTERGPACSG